MKTGIIIGIVCFAMAQIIAWFSSNALILSERTARHYIPMIVILSPLTGLGFAFGTKHLYDSIDELWAVRFFAFAIGYLIFIPLAWWFFDESPLTIKNVVSTLLCLTLISVQVFWK
jgi:hypothetical protein